MRGALSDLRIGPGKSTAPLHSKLLDRPEFRTVDMDIHWVERMLKED
jgi:biotin carboxylase